MHIFALLCALCESQLIPFPFLRTHSWRELDRGIKPLLHFHLCNLSCRSLLALNLDLSSSPQFLISALGRFSPILLSLLWLIPPNS